MTISIGNQARAVSLPDIYRKKATPPLPRPHSYSRIYSASPGCSIVKTDYATISYQHRSLSERQLYTKLGQSNLRKVTSCPDIVESSVESAKRRTICSSELPKLSDSVCNLACLDGSMHSESALNSSLASLPIVTAHTSGSGAGHLLMPESRAESISLLSSCSTPAMRQPSVSQASIDTFINFLDSLDASNERNKQNLAVDDIILIAIKRWFCHAGSGTALADSLNYRNHPYYAGASILIMSFVGLTDAAYKIGEKNRGGSSFVLSFCNLVHQSLLCIQECIPAASISAFKQLYYNCSLIAAAFTVPADLFAHMNDAGILNAEFIQPVICPLTICLPTILAAVLTCKELSRRTVDSKDLTLGAKEAIKVILQRVAIHATAGTVSADIASYLGHPEFAMAAIIVMGSIGLIDGLVQCGEQLQNDDMSSSVNPLFKRICETLYYLGSRLEAIIPEFLNKLIDKTYLHTSIAGAAGTIFADVFSYFGCLSRPVKSVICPMTVALFTSCGAIPSIVTEIINQMVKPPTTQAHFLMRDVPIRIV